MTENTAPAEASPAPLFAALRTDPAKVRDGVWFEHPETGDRFRCRRPGCMEHVRAAVQGREAHELAHPKPVQFVDDDARQQWQDGRDRWVEAAGLAHGVIVDWHIASNPDRPYDADAMAAALRDPQLQDLRDWLIVALSNRKPFRPGPDVVGN